MPHTKLTKSQPAKCLRAIRSESLLRQHEKLVAPNRDQSWGVSEQGLLEGKTLDCTPSS